MCVQNCKQTLATSKSFADNFFEALATCGAPMQLQLKTPAVVGVNFSSQSLLCVYYSISNSATAGWWAIDYRCFDVIAQPDVVWESSATLQCHGSTVLDWDSAGAAAEETPTTSASETWWCLVTHAYLASPAWQVWHHNYWLAHYAHFSSSFLMFGCNLLSYCI